MRERTNEPEITAQPFRSSPIERSTVEDMEPRADLVNESILGCTIHSGSSELALAHVLDRLKRREPTALVFANANFLIQMRRTADIDLSSFLVLNDGVAVDVARRLLSGSPFPANLNGTDFIPALLDRVPAGSRTFLFGGRPEVVAEASGILEARHAIEICGHRSGFGYDEEEVVAAINASRADIILVALGNPRQERWIADNRARLDAPLLIGVGALLDFVSGAIPRAPMWLRRARLEWLYRLVLEPRRLVRRYTVDTSELLFLALQERWRGRGLP